MYKANKPCKFGDRQFYIGDEIPEELIDQNRVKTLVKYGTILNVPDAASEPPKAETGTNTSTDAENGSEGDKQALNEAEQPPEAESTEAEQPPEAKPGKPAKKGGK